jgi:hypothetical protein
VQRTERDCFEYEHLQCALRKFNRFCQKGLSYLIKESILALSFSVKESATAGGLPVNCKLARSALV